MVSMFNDIFNEIKNSNDFVNNARLLEYLGRVLKNNISRISPIEKTSIIDLAIGEMRRIMDLIPKAKNYREKETLFAYEDKVLMIYTLFGKPEEIDEAQIALIQKIIQLVSKERVLETAVDAMFELPKIDKEDIEKVLAIARPLKDDYQRGMLYRGLHEYNGKMKNMTCEAKNALAEYTAEEMNKILERSQMSEDAVTVLEFAADVCKYFATDEILNALEKIMDTDNNQIRYFAFETLLENKRDVAKETVEELARDLGYAVLVKGLLDKFGKGMLFPKELDTPEYLAKSDMVRWLSYPTELDGYPDEIELIGRATVKKEIFHIFKFKSNSDNLSDDNKNTWLIGWSGNDGSTFSDFDKLSDFEKKTPEKTLKHIVKKLIK